MEKEEISRAKRFRCEKFHSRLLIPWNISERAVRENDIEPVLLWIDVYQQGYKFKEGQEVAHRENLSQKIFVQKILVANITLPSKQQFAKMIGILCHWWEDCPCSDEVDYKPSEKEQYETKN